MTERWTIGLLLVLAALFAYAPVVHFEFVHFDDAHYLLENPRIQQGLGFETVRWAFTTRYFNNWHPLTWLSYALDARLFGLRPGPFHATNALLHAANALLLFIVLDRLTGHPRRSGLVAALFALHPLHVESVAWVSERKDVLSAFFGLLAVGAYAGWARRGGAWRYALVTLWLVLGLLSKPVLVTLPCVFLLLDFWPLGRLSRARAGARVAEKLPWLALAAASCAITLVAQQRAGDGFEAIPLSLRIANAVDTYAAYLGHAVWPRGLACLYPHPYLPGGAPLPAGRLAAAAGLLLAVSVGVTRFRRTGYAVVGWLWYLGMLVPTIGLVQVGVQARADRYTYLPLIGIFVLVSFGGADVLQRLRGGAARRRLAAGLALGLALACALATRAQVGTWRDSVTLYRHALASTGDNWVIQYNLANVLREQGRVDESLEHFRAALAIAPHRSDVRFNLAGALRARGRLQPAASQLRAVLALEPDHPKAALELGRLLLARRALPEAVEVLELAARNRPDSWNAAYHLALAHAQSGRPRLAIARFEEALRLTSGSTRPGSELAWLLATHPDPEVRNGARAASLAGDAAREPGPDLAHALAALAAARAETGDLAGAVEAAERALERAGSDGSRGLEERIRRSLARFRQGRPVREDPATGRDGGSGAAGRGPVGDGAGERTRGIPEH